MLMEMEVHTKMATLVSVYEMPSDVATVVRKLKSRGFDDLTTYAPAPFPEIEEAEDNLITL